MSGWNVDVPGVESLLGTLDGDVGELRSAVSDADSAISGCTAALQGPVATAFTSFAALRHAAPGELVTMADNAAGAAIGAVAALSAGNEQMANQMRQDRIGTSSEAVGWQFNSHWTVTP